MGLANKEADKTLKEKHTANVADAIKNFQRKEQIQLGQLDGVDITPFDFEFPEEALTQAKDYLSDRTALEEKIINKQGEINIPAATNLPGTPVGLEPPPNGGGVLPNLASKNSVVRCCPVR